MSSAHVDVFDDNIFKAKIQNAVQEYARKYGMPPTLKDDCPYPEVPGLPNAYEIFQLGHGGLPDEQRSRAIDCAKQHHAKYQANFLGYEFNQKLDKFDEEFGSYLNISINNIGDAFQEGSYALNTKFMERAVLDYFAELWHIQYPHNADEAESYWGFGGTEGNMYGMCNARDYLSGKKILIDNSLKIVKNKSGISDQLMIPRPVYHSAPKPADNQNAYNPIAFYSEDTHYSLSKSFSMLNIRSFYAEGSENYAGLCPLENSNGEWPMEVPLYESGSMDLDALAVLVEFFASQGYPIIVNFNYGTTFKGAYDDVESACVKLRPILQKYNLLEREVHYDVDDYSKFETRTGFWFHVDVDGATGATHTPYLEMAYGGGLTEEMPPTFDFRLPMIHSIATSSGALIPQVLYMTRTKYQMLPPADSPDYIGMPPDTTSAGHRNALSPMLLWSQIARKSYEDQVFRAIRLDQLAGYAEKSFLKLQEEDLKEDLYVERSPLALSILFKRASDEIVRKYTLSNALVNGIIYSRIVIMDHVTETLIDNLIADLSKPGAFAEHFKVRIGED